jgi:hypothetical protein
MAIVSRLAVQLQAINRKQTLTSCHFCGGSKLVPAVSALTPRARYGVLCAETKRLRGWGSRSGSGAFAQCVEASSITVLLYEYEPKRLCASPRVAHISIGQMLSPFRLSYEKHGNCNGGAKPKLATKLPAEGKSWTLGAAGRVSLIESRRFSA